MADNGIRFSLNQSGYITNWLTTGTRVTPFIAPHTDPNQLKFEHDMRQILALDLIDQPQLEVTLGAESQIGRQWQYYCGNGNSFIDFNKFYFTLSRVEILCAAQLVAEKPMRAEARLWSYAAVDIWLNGQHCGNIKAPVYKPISFIDITLDLKEGINDVFICLQNFGVRDTRNMVALQLKDTNDITVTLPADKAALARIAEFEAWLVKVKHDGRGLTCDAPPPAPVSVDADGRQSVWTDGLRYDAEAAYRFTLTAEICGQQFLRNIEISANNQPHFIDAEDKDERWNRLLTGLSTVGSFNHTSGYNVLARYKLTGELGPEDYEAIDYMLEKVEERIDCADFALTCLLRMYIQLPLGEALKDKIKKYALRFRYWMDENAADAMCFWSENHSLLFHGCQMLAGKLWPEEVFLRSGNTGARQYEIGVRRCTEWLDVVEKEGFEEYMAGGYMVVTCVALLTLVDFGNEVLAARAAKVIDRIIEENARQFFHGVPFAPMGRVYRGVLSPHTSGVQALLHFFDANAAEGYDRWIATFLYSAYQAPKGLDKLMNDDVDISFNDGRALIFTKKTKDYMLTSAASPRPIPTVQGIDENTEYYHTKLLNEGFHGTTFFVPGEDGYQQHMWYAAIANDCFVFVNHPGNDKDIEGMRPGYWYGNGVFPAVKQEGSVLYCYYKLPDCHPTRYTHVYWPSWAMAESFQKQGWLFGRRGESYIAIWCSSELTPYDDVLIGCEYRAYADQCGWICCCGSKEEAGSFEEFMNQCLKSAPTAEAVESKF